MDRSPPYMGDDVIGATFLHRGATVMLLTITTTYQPATDLRAQFFADRMCVFTRVGVEPIESRAEAAS
jgi:hypothetical protein